MHRPQMNLGLIAKVGVAELMYDVATDQAACKLRERQLLFNLFRLIATKIIH